MQGRKGEKWRKKGRKVEGRNGGYEDYFKKGWLVGYEREMRLRQEQKEEEEQEKNGT